MSSANYEIRRPPAKPFKPMKASQVEDFSKLRFPLLASPKIDGIRAVVRGGVLLSNSLKPIPNEYTQRLFGRPEYEGFDGELVVGEPNDPNCMQHTTSGVMSRSGEPDVRYFVFDRTDCPEPFRNRLQFLLGWFWLEPPERMTLLHQELIETPDQLDTYEAGVLALGFEGVMVRRPDSPYKFGRSTEREGFLLKIKRFVDSEAEVIGFEERMHNANEAKTNALGHTERSSHKANLIPMGTLGALLVRTPAGVEFSVGTGFTDEQRAHYWAVREQLVGKIVTYKHFEVGVKDAPRFPVFKAFRHDNDIS